MVALPQPSQFNHYSPKPTVAGLADPLFAFNATTVEGRCAQTCVRSERFAISKATNERLAHEDGRTLRANAAQRGEMLDHLPSLIRGSVLKHSVPLTFQCRDLGE